MSEEIKKTLEDVKRHLDYLEATKQCSIRDNEMKVMYNYITNLRKENQILKENAEHNDKVVDKAKWNEMIYKSRNEKAIEFIKNETEDLANKIDDYAISKYLKRDLLNILQGGDE